MRSDAERSVVRFGVFEMDLDARELRRSGVRVRLQDQPFRVLALLVERPGEIVTREEIKDAIWAEDTFVEFDHGLNTVVQKIRQALLDSATSPRFLETVPRRGYRFIAPVDVTGAGPVRQQEPTEPRRRFLWTAVAGLAAVAVSAGWWLTHPTDSAFDPGAFQLRRLTYDGGLAYQPAISADGKLVVYASDRAGEGNLDIWLQQTAGGDPIQLTSDGSDEFEPSFSPDAAQVVFRSSRGDGGIYVVASLGGEPRWLAPDGRRPRFSPDGRRVAYWIGKEHVSGGSNSRVLLVASEGGEPTEVGFGRSPVWSPEGDRLLYLRSGRGGPSRPEWVTAKLDGGEPSVTGALEFLRGSKLAGDPKILGQHVFVPDRWLNDGRVLFSAGGREAFNIWSIHLPYVVDEHRLPPSESRRAAANTGLRALRTIFDLLFQT